MTPSPPKPAPKPKMPEPDRTLNGVTGELRYDQWGRYMKCKTCGEIVPYFGNQHKQDCERCGTPYVHNVMRKVHVTWPRKFLGFNLPPIKRFVRWEYLERPEQLPPAPPQP